MSSYWEWVENVIVQYDQEKFFVLENGQFLKFKVGDFVIYMNLVGLEFVLCVIGFYECLVVFDGMYVKGVCYLLDWECLWFFVVELCLCLDELCVV